MIKTLQITITIYYCWTMVKLIRFEYFFHIIHTCIWHWEFGMVLLINNIYSIYLFEDTEDRNIYAVAAINKNHCEAVIIDMITKVLLERSMDVIKAKEYTIYLP
eukprot:362479_1